MTTYKKGICFLFVLIAIAIVVTIFTKPKEITKPQESQQENSEVVRTGNARVSEIRFWIFAEQGSLVVYKVGNSDVYFDTGILLEELPEEIQHEIEEGKPFDSEQSLFEFLESYSS